MSSSLNEKAIIAILRGIQKDQVVPLCSMLIEQGWHGIEIPFYDEQSIEAITLLCEEFGNIIPCGAGTVTTMEQLRRLKSCQNLSLVVSPHTDDTLIREAVKDFSLVMPGIFSPRELVRACHAGATNMKLFPASVGGTDLLKSLKSISEDHIRFYAIGGIKPEDFSKWIAAGADGFGIGGELFKPQYSPSEVRDRGQRLITAFQQAVEESAS